MPSLYELPCHHSPTCSDSLLEQLLSYLPTRFPSLIFDYIAYENSDHESVHSHDSSVSAFYSDNSTYFSSTFFTIFVFFCFVLSNPKNTSEKWQAHNVRKGRRPRTTDNPEERPEGPRLQETRRGWQAAPANPGAQAMSTPRTPGLTAAS